MYNPPPPYLAAPPVHGTTPTARPAALTVAVVLIFVGGLCTLVDLYLDRQFLPVMFAGNPDLRLFQPFVIVRDIADVLGVIATTGLVAATLRRINWARVTLAAACLVYALANLGAAAVGSFTLAAGMGMFNEGGDSSPQRIIVLNALSVGADVLVAVLVVVCAVILFSRSARAFTASR